MTAPLRVLHILDKLSVDGSKIHGPARQVSYRVPCYDRARFEVRAVSLRAEEPAAGVLRESGVPVTCLGRSKFDPRTLTDLRRMIREWRPDVLHLSGYAAWTFGRVAGRLCGVPAVVQEHFVDPKMPAVQRLADWLLQGWEREAIAVSESVKRFMAAERFVRRAPIRVIGNGVPVARLRSRGAGAGQAVRRQLGLQPGTPVIGIVGRLAEMKGHAYFLQAAQRIAARIPDAAFVIVGEGPLAESLKRLAGELGLAARVHFVGYQADVVSYMSAFTVGVISSIFGEGFCSVGIESFAAGAPLVMTEISAVDGVFEHRKNALIVPVRDAEALAEAVLELLGEPALASRLAAAGQATLEACRIEQVAEHYMECYESAIAPGRIGSGENGRALAQVQSAAR